MKHLRGDTVTPKLKTEPPVNHQRELELLKVKELKNQLRAGKLGRVS